LEARLAAVQAAAGEQQGHAEWLAWQVDLMNIMHQMQLPTGNPSGPPTSTPPTRTQTSHPDIKFNWDNVEPLDIWPPEMPSPKPVDQQLAPTMVLHTQQHEKQDPQMNGAFESDGTLHTSFLLRSLIPH